MKENITKNGSLYLLSLGVVTGIAGSLSPWLELPLSAPTMGINSPFFMTDVGAPSLTFSFGNLYICTVIIGSISIVLKCRILGILSIALAFFFLFYFPVYNGFLNSDWINSFIQENKVKQSLESFIRAYYWPNIGRPPLFITEFQFNSFHDRLLIVSKMMGWGWFLALFGAIFLWLSSNIICNNDRKTILLEVSILTIIISIFYFLILDVIRADNFHKDGNNKLASGDWALALDSYNKAIKLDNTLQFSKSFVTGVSKAFYHTYGNNYPWSQFYIADQALKSRNPKQKLIDVANKNKKIQLALNSSLMAEPNAILEHSIYNLTDQIKTDSWIEKGHFFYSQGYVKSALQAYRNAVTSNRLDVRFFIAHAYQHEHNFDQSINHTAKVLETVYNPFVKSVLSCSLGDMYQEAREFNLARQAFFNCMDFDSDSNYHAAKSLGGT